MPHRHPHHSKAQLFHWDMPTLVRHNVECMIDLRSRAPVGMDDDERLYCEMLWAIGRWRWGAEYSKAMRTAYPAMHSEPRKL
jgi:hypothetical protein